MSNNNYKRGAAFERRVMAMCEKAGYTTFRTAGSHGIADIIAIKRIDIPPDSGMTPTFNVDGYSRSIVLFIQCKYGAKISKKERDVLFALDFGPSVNIFIAWG